ncbi:M20/M25/M40 family metallo-hydrolase [Actinophytocola xinjiangensis]|uniref:M20/M25/M40 family metallo-hydrolase n=1 Tax=Actinophytocola xinjiangensis TaxID=485602 RepID=UPI000A0149DF|nr:M20/M25/M40 family metallo-hydrolase [Actinophytocola xinjiangensis]
MRVRWQAVAAPVMVLLVAAGSALISAVPADGGGFEVDRARAHVDRIAAAPRPPGSAQHERVRAYLVDQLSALGLDPRVDSRTVVTPFSTSSHVAGLVHNVSGTLPGSGDGRVILAAHYDSVPIGPGATDNGMGVSTALEVVRVLAQQPNRRNDVQVLFTDGEELGLLGSRAFTEATSPDRSVVLNLDARGTSGRVVMYETGPRSAEVVSALRHEPPVTTSLADEVYRLLPNETDFVEFTAAGFAGLNFAMVGGSARYDSPEDDLANTDPEAHADMGAVVLAAASHLVDADLGALADSAEPTFFTVVGLLARYPAGVALPLALVAAVGLLAACLYARRRGLLRVSAAAVRAAAVPVAPVAAAGLGWLGWQALVLVEPEYGDFSSGDPYAVTLPRIGFAALAVGVVWLWLAWARRRSTGVETAAAVAGWLALLGLVSAVTLPGAAYLVTWPAVAGAAAVALAARVPEAWRPLVLCAPAVVGAALVAPLVVPLADTFGLAGIAVPLAIGCLLATAIPFRPRRTAPVAVVAAVLAVGLFTTAIATDRDTAGAPDQVSLMYGLDVDRNAAYWVSEDPTGDNEWLDGLVGTNRVPLEERFPYFVGADGMRAAPAPVADIPQPYLRREKSSTEGDLRRTTVRIGGDGRPAMVGLYVDGTVVNATIASTHLPGGVNRPYATPWRWGLVVSGPPADGVEVVLTTRGPARAMVAAHSGEVPTERPDTVTWRPEGSGLSVAVRSYDL